MKQKYNDKCRTKPISVRLITSV